MNTHTLAGDAAAVIDAATRAAGNAADQAVHLAHQGTEAARYSAEQWQARARHWERSTRSYIEHEPVKATLIAMAAGAALVLLGGLLVRGRRAPR
jgi:ElaB/YqjD/DUF883 family membrane-anchored ribosome-binding protein